MTKFGMFVLMGVMALGWRAAFSGMEEKQFFTWVIVIHIVSWILQFIGHGVFESKNFLRQNENLHFLTI